MGTHTKISLRNSFFRVAVSVNFQAQLKSQLIANDPTLPQKQRPKRHLNSVVSSGVLKSRVSHYVGKGLAAQQSRPHSERKKPTGWIPNPQDGEQILCTDMAPSRSRTWAATANKAALALPNLWQLSHISRQIRTQACPVVGQETRNSIPNLALLCR